MNTMIWLAVMIILIVVEIATVGLTTIWFAAGAMAAVIVSVIGGGLLFQLTVFLAVSICLLICTRPFAVKYINATRIRTNCEGIIGRIVCVTQEIDNAAGKGCAVVNGQEWTARALDDGIRIVSGSLAKVVDIKGVKLIVEVCKEEKSV